MRLAGRSVIVTGGSSGIGEAVSRLFAEEGARITIAARSESAGTALAAQIRDAGGEAQFVRTDIASTSDLDGLFDSHLEAFGTLDVLVNNAAYEGAGHSVVDTTEDELDRVIGTTLKATFLACQRAARIMLEAGHGGIINVTAASAREGLAWPNLGAYIAAKGGVISLTRALAVELAPVVRVNSLNPGVVDTPMLRGFANKQESPETFWEGMEQIQLLRRLGSPNDIANAALFLASDESAYITGTDLLVDGGLVLG